VTFQIWKVADLVGFGGIHAFRQSSYAENYSRDLSIVLMIMGDSAQPFAWTDEAG
jgi:hypothetical protein